MRFENIDIEKELQGWTQQLMENWECRGYDQSYEGIFKGNDGTPGCYMPLDAACELVDSYVEEVLGDNYDSFKESVVKAEGVRSGILAFISNVIYYFPGQRESSNSQGVSIQLSLCYLQYLEF